MRVHDDAEIQFLSSIDKLQELAKPPLKRSFKDIVRDHWLLITFISILAVTVIVVSITVPICIIRGCPAHSTPSNDTGGIPRMILKFNVPGINATEQLPAILQPYVDNIILQTSDLQILTAISEDVYQEVAAYLQDLEELDFLVRDFSFRIPPAPPSSSSIAAEIEQLLTSFSVNQRHLAQAGGLGDPLLPLQWNHNTTQDYAAWNITKGSSEIIVAILDTGIDWTHPDLVDNIWHNVNEIPGNGIDDDHNGFIDDVIGWDFGSLCEPLVFNSYGLCATYCIPGSGNLTDQSSESHGTQVSGCVAERDDNGIGGRGVAPRVRIMPIKIADCNQLFFGSAAAQAYDYALRMGASIVSCSFSMTLGYQYYPTSQGTAMQKMQTNVFYNAIMPLSNAGVLTVVAAGNEDINLNYLKQLGWAYTPCLVSGIPNFICVGATTQTDTEAYWMNYGSQVVTVNSPGVDIVATIANASYGPLSGTSQATPLVSGAAALVATVLAATTGNVRQAALVKSLLLSNADVFSGYRVNTSARINTFKAVAAATKVAGFTMLTPLPYNASTVAVAVTGWNVSYRASLTVATPLTPALVNSIMLTQATENTFMAGTTYLSTFFKATGFAALSTIVPLRAGYWSLYMNSTNAAGNMLIQINGNYLNVTNQTAGIAATSDGIFNLTLFVYNPTNNQTYNLTFRNLDDDVTYNVNSNFVYVSNTTAPLSYIPVTSTVLTRGFQVNYNLSSSSTLAKYSLPLYTESAFFTNTGVLPDLNLVKGAVTNALTPAAPWTAAVGYAVTYLPPITFNTSTQFLLSCAGATSAVCQLLIDGLIVADTYPTPTATPPVLSPCVELASGVMHQLIVRFGLSSLAKTPLTLSWGICGGDPASFTSVAPYTSMPALWDLNSNSAGYVAGMQCDVWRNATIPAGAPPTYKVRVGACSSGTDTLSSACGPANFSLALSSSSLLPSLSTTFPPSGTQRFSIRCWAYLSGSYPLGIQASPATTTMWLGGRPVFMASSSTASNVPTTTSLNTTRQLLVIEWRNLLSSTIITLYAGGSPLSLVGLSAAALPIPVSPASALLGAAGINMTSYLTTPLDVASLVVEGTADMAPSGISPAVFSQTGLVGTFGANTRLRGVLHYAITNGWLSVPTSTPANYTIQWQDGAAQVSSLVAGNVTLINSPAAGAATQIAQNASQISTVQIYLPYNGYVSMEIITKSKRSDGSVQYNASILTPASASGPIGIGGWMMMIGS